MPLNKGRMWIHQTIYFWLQNMRSLLLEIWVILAKILLDNDDFFN